MAKRHKKVSTEGRSKFSEALIGILDQIAGALVKELKMEPGLARQAAEMSVEMIRETTGGGTLYVAKGHLYTITEKHRTIYRRFTGSNHFQLAREFDLTERQIYTIVERCQSEEFEKKQPSLFQQNG